MTSDTLTSLLTFSGTLFLLRFHWFWLLVALGLGAAVGWKTAGESSAMAADPAEGDAP